MTWPSHTGTFAARTGWSSRLTISACTVIIWPRATGWLMAEGRSTVRQMLATYEPVRLTVGGACEKARTWNPLVIEGIAK